MTDGAVCFGGMSTRSRRARLFGHELKGLLALAGPIIVNQLGQIGMTTADTIMVGPLGAAPLAAAGLGSALQHLGLTMGMGAVMGMAPLVSQAYGAGDRAECRRVFVQGVWFALMLGVPLSLYCLFGRELSLLLGQDEEVSILTGRFLRALALGVAPALVFVAARQYLEGMGHVTVPMVVTFIGLSVNVLLNKLFIYGVDGWIPALGVEGSGWATTTSVRWLMVIITGVYLATHRSLNPLRDVSMRPNGRLLRVMMRVGGPIGGQFGLEVGLFAFAAVMMGWLGGSGAGGASSDDQHCGDDVHGGDGSGHGGCDPCWSSHWRGPRAFGAAGGAGHVSVGCGLHGLLCGGVCGDAASADRRLHAASGYHRTGCAALAGGSGFPGLRWCTGSGHGCVAGARVTRTCLCWWPQWDTGELDCRSRTCSRFGRSLDRWVCGRAFRSVWPW